MIARDCRPRHAPYRTVRADRGPRDLLGSSQARPFMPRPEGYAMGLDVAAGEVTADERRNGSRDALAVRAFRTLGIPSGVSVLVVRAPDEGGISRCDDEPLTPRRPPACSAVLDKSGTIRPGDRFSDPVSGLEVVCTRAGDGVLSFAGRPLQRGPGPDRQPGDDA